MTRAQQAAAEISSYLLLGAHHSTPDGRIAMAATIARHLAEQAADQSRFWEDCLRCVVADKDRQIARLTHS